MARVLIVEDDPAVASVIERIIREQGHHTSVSHHVLSSLKILKETFVDLVITDIVMPDVTGIKLIDILREHYPDIKIIAVSGGGPQYGPDCCLTLADERGAHGILKKPIEPRKLSEMVQELLSET